MPRPVIVIAAAVLVASAVIALQLSRANVSLWDAIVPPTRFDVRDAIAGGQRVAHGEPIAVFAPRHIGRAVTVDDRPLVANVTIVDLDRDGRADIVAADAAANRVVWLQQGGDGAFSERELANVAGPAHVSAVDFDRDGDLDVLVASLGVLFPNNAPIGAVIVLENNGRQQFTLRTLIDKIARVSDVEAGDLDGDGDLDLAVAQFGYDQGETRWLENRGDWRFESHIVQSLSGGINAVIADADQDGDLDIVSLISQEWEEIYVLANDGHGVFTPQRVFGAANEDFGSSWVSVVDLDRDGDVDILYSNGDAFDYAPPKGRNWNGVQWLENTGRLKFTYHRIADYPGASSPQAADVDGDNDLDIVVVSAYNDWVRPTAQSLVWFQNDGAMGFTMRDLANTPTHLLTLAIGDLNADGLPDLVTGGAHISWPYDRLSRFMIWINQWPGVAASSR